MTDPLELATPPAWPPTPVLRAEELRAVFDRATTLSVGVEDELMLVDPHSFALVPAAQEVLAGLRDDRYVPELRLAQIEIVTPVCATASRAAAELAAARTRLVKHVGGRVRLAGAGTHPFSTDFGPLSDDERYRLIGEEFVWASRRSLACGFHVHVAVGSADRALGVYNAVRSFLPQLAALAANSPFFEGVDSGLCSVRPKLNEAFPRAGVPPAFVSWEEYAAFLRWGRTGGLFPDASHFWWDLRLNTSHGTIELRVADAQTRVADAGAITAVFHALVAWLDDRARRGETLPVHETHRIHENSWRAARYGVQGWLVDLDTGRPEPTRELLRAFLERLEPYAVARDGGSELEHARTLLGGNGADRQRYVHAKAGMDGLVAWLADETERA